jgi:hypothetical protein
MSNHTARDLYTRPALSFKSWLRAQHRRDDSIGDLSRDVRQDAEWPLSQDIPELIERLYMLGASGACMEALILAHREWSVTYVVPFRRPFVEPLAGTPFSRVTTAWRLGNEGQLVADVAPIDTRLSSDEGLSPTCACGAACWVGLYDATWKDPGTWSCGKCGASGADAVSVMPAGAPISRADRRAVPAAIRWIIIREADYTCSYCKRRHYSSQIGPDNRPWHLDHIVPLARGGEDTPENLCLSCAACNQRKHARLPHEFQS